MLETHRIRPILGACLLLVAGATQGAGDAAAGKAKSAICAGCHGSDGNAAVAMYPNLAGQGAPYLVKQLEDFKAGTRTNPIMQGQVTSLTKQDMEDLAAYFASQTAKLGTVERRYLSAGDVYRGGNPDTGVAACASCHGPGGEGNLPAKFPALSGQNPDYVNAQMKAFKSRQRNNDFNGMMRDVAARLSDSEIEALSHYVRGLQVEF